MPGRHLSIRVSEETLEHLESESRRSGRSRSDLARTLIEEGLRMQAHPGIVFRQSVAGPQPALADGPYLWKIAAFLHGLDLSDEEAVCEAMSDTNLTRRQIEAAARYYTEYAEEIDARIRRNQEENERAYAAWLRERGSAAR